MEKPCYSSGIFMVSNFLEPPLKRTMPTTRQLKSLHPLPQVSSELSESHPASKPQRRPCSSWSISPKTADKFNSVKASELNDTKQKVTFCGIVEMILELQKHEQCHRKPLQQVLSSNSNSSGQNSGTVVLYFVCHRSR